MSVCSSEGCDGPALVKCGGCDKWLCGKHALITKDVPGVRCEGCSKQPTFCGECPSCEEGHYERCTSKP
jgi:hypothetical protein